MDDSDDESAPIKIPHGEETEAPHNDVLMFPNIWHRILICGTSAAGKSYLLLQLVPLLDFDNLCIFCPTAGQPVMRGIMEWAPQHRKTLTVSTSLDGLYRCGKRSLIIVDDFPDKKEIMRAKTLFATSRHNQQHVILIAQYYHEIPRLIRDNASIAVLLKTDATKSIHMDFSEYISFKRFKDLMRSLSLMDHEYLLINRFAPPGMQVRLSSLTTFVTNAHET